MVVLSNTAEGGSNGTTVTTGNSGGTSGTAWDTVTIGASATLTFDNAHSAHGGLAYKVTTPVSATTSFAQWASTAIPSATTTAYIRLYLYATANPANNSTIARFLTVGGAATCAIVLLTNTGKIRLNDPAATQMTITTQSITLNAWNRVEIMCVGSATVGQGEIKLYKTSADSTAAADETVTSAATFNTSGQIRVARFGVSTNVASTTYWLDDLAYSDVAYLGSAVFTGTSAQTLPALTQTASGTRTVPVFTGSSAQTLPSLTQSAAGTRTVPVFTGASAQTLPALSQSAAGTRTVPTSTGTAAQTLPSVTQSAAGTSADPVSTGTSAQTLPALSQTATGTVLNPRVGTASQTLPALTQSASGSRTVPVFTGSSAQTLPAIGTTALGAVTVPTFTGTITQALPHIGQSATGTTGVPTFTGVIAQTLPAVISRGQAPPTPPERITVIQAENRAVLVGAETRATSTSTETRTHLTRAEDRRFVILAEDRTG